MIQNESPHTDRDAILIEILTALMPEDAKRRLAELRAEKASLEKARDAALAADVQVRGTRLKLTTDLQVMDMREREYLTRVKQLEEDKLVFEGRAARDRARVKARERAVEEAQQRVKEQAESIRKIAGDQIGNV